MVRLVDLDHKWAHEIGRVFIAFGSIEYTVHTLLKMLPADPIHPAVTGLRLGQKLDILIAVLDARKGMREASASALLKRVKVLSEDRNLIAHNPLALDLYITKEGDLTLQESIRHMRNSGRHLSFSEVEGLRNSTEELASALLEAQLALAPSG